jgi:hypothetical protein
MVEGDNERQASRLERDKSRLENSVRGYLASLPPRP